MEDITIWYNHTAEYTITLLLHSIPSHPFLAPFALYAALPAIFATEYTSTFTLSFTDILPALYAACFQYGNSSNTVHSAIICKLRNNTSSIRLKTTACLTKKTLLLFRLLTQIHSFGSSQQFRLPSLRLDDRTCLIPPFFLIVLVDWALKQRNSFYFRECWGTFYF